MKLLSFRNCDSWLTVARENAGESVDSARLARVATRYEVLFLGGMSFTTASQASASAPRRYIR